MDGDSRRFANRVRHSGIDYIDAGMHAPIVRDGSAQKRQPYQEITGQLFRPEQGMIEYITAENLDRDNDGHGKAEPEKNIFNPLVDGSAQLGKSWHAAVIPLRYL